MEQKKDPQTQEEWLKYRKSVRFVMAKLNKEKDDLAAEVLYLKSQLKKFKDAFK